MRKDLLTKNKTNDINIKQELFQKIIWRKIPEQEIIDGVCGGLAYWLKVPVMVIRSLFIIFNIAGLGLYILLALSLTEWYELPNDYCKRTKTKKFTNNTE